MKNSRTYTVWDNFPISLKYSCTEKKTKRKQTSQVNIYYSWTAGLPVISFFFFILGWIIWNCHYSTVLGSQKQQLHMVQTNTFLIFSLVCTVNLSFRIRKMIWRHLHEDRILTMSRMTVNFIIKSFHVYYCITVFLLAKAIYNTMFHKNI